VLPERITVSGVTHVVHVIAEFESMPPQGRMPAIDIRRSNGLTASSVDGGRRSSPDLS
jgi:hypothetical protein